MNNCFTVEAKAALEDNSLVTSMEMAEAVAAVESEIISEHNSEEGKHYNVLVDYVGVQFILYISKESKVLACKVALLARALSLKL